MSSTHAEQTISRLMFGSTMGPPSTGVVVQAGRAHEAFASVAFFVFAILTIGVEKHFAKETGLLPGSLWGFFGQTRTGLERFL